MGSTRIFGGASVLMILSASAAFITLELLPTGLSSISDATSYWALTPYYWGFRWFEVSLAVGGLALGLALSKTLPRMRTPVLIMLTLFAAGRGVIGWVNIDPMGAPATLRGDIHWALGIISFLSSIIAMILASRGMRRSDGSRHLSAFSLIMGIITSAFILLLLGAARISALTGYFGVFERGYYISTMVWIVVISFCALTRSGPRDATLPTRADET